MDKVTPLEGAFDIKPYGNALKSRQKRPRNNGVEMNDTKEGNWCHR